jgi:hypothetical protein
LLTVERILGNKLLVTQGGARRIALVEVHLGVSDCDQILFERSTLFLGSGPVPKSMQA